MQQLRVDHAVKRLADREVTLASLALECGFSDQSHFNRVFRKLTGMTPGEFRTLRFGADP